MERWLSCRISKGMFPEEVAVVVSSSEGQQLSFFLPKDRVEFGEAGQGLIRVVVLDEDERVGLVALPAEPIEGPQVAKVPRAALSAA
jgi:hypothetical protein